MKRFFVTILLWILLFGIQLYAKTDSIPGLGIITPTEDENSPSGWYIPEDMDECFEELDNILPENIQDSFKILDFKTTYSKYKYLNQWMLNSWKIWDSSVVVQYFNKFGFYEPAEISLGIFHSYWKYLNDLPITIDKKPKYYALGKNLFIKYANKEYRYPGNPAIYGKIINTDSTPQFTFLGKELTLLDSLYAPILQVLYENGFNPSGTLNYIWWTQVAIFGVDNDDYPNFLDEEEIELNYSDEASYDADFIMIIEEDYGETLQGL